MSFAARLGALLSLSAIVVIVEQYLREPQAMLRNVTIWMHLHRFHVLPSAAWLLLVAGFGFAAVLFLIVDALIARSERRRYPATRVYVSHAPYAPPPAALVTAAAEAYPARDLLLDIFERCLQRDPLGGASPSKTSFPGRLDMNAKLIMLRIELAVLNVALKMATNDQAAFVAAMQKFVTKGGDLATSFAESLVAKQFASNPLLNLLATEFEPSVTAAIEGEVKTLEGEAANEEEKYLAIGAAYLETEIGAIEAQIAAETSPPPALPEVEPLGK